MSFRGTPKHVSCEYKCPGNQNEICGGPNKMSVYDIRLIDTKSKPPPKTHTLTTTIESINSFSEQSMYNKDVQTPISAKQTTKTAVQTTTATIAAVQTTIVAETTIATVQTKITAETTIATVQTTITAEPTTIRSTTPNTSMKTTSELTSTDSGQVDLDTGRRTNDLVSVYISVPVLITIAAAFTVVIILCLRRKGRHIYDQLVCFRRKKVTNNRYLFNSAADDTCNMNTFNDYINCSHHSPMVVQNSSADLYAEIAFGSTESLQTSENGYSTVSIGLHQGQYTTDVTEDDRILDRYSVKSSDQDDRSQHEYDILEQEGYSVVLE
ncbi:uncharacterized protein LOC123540359 isoform X2 [Mercenaria mercenaria]|uniref:uncharacterized protein LOC123540359 isoform X2 n=1 Tax=Mercenaria mercenaria TaxID=6596 RepID=UPI00234F1B80|nr:uncharacterized protein LOC123540359 isoform X2 [Mercenaria mercenaria]